MRIFDIPALFRRMYGFQVFDSWGFVLKKRGMARSQNPSLSLRELQYIIIILDRVIYSFDDYTNERLDDNFVNLRSGVLFSRREN